MTETIETGLVYIHRISPTKKFIGCGALIEGTYVATCRHVWRDATNAGANGEVEVEYPRARENGATALRVARLVDACEEDAACDLVLLEACDIPGGIMALQLARHDRFEVGPGFAHARLARTDAAAREVWRDFFPKGELDPNRTGDGMRQFTGTSPQGYWFTSGSSGSPVFLDRAQQLAGLLSLSELGANEGESHLQAALVVPATVIWSFVSKRLAQPIAAQEGIDPRKLQSVLDALGMQDVPIADIPARLTQAIAEMRAHAAEPVLSSNDGSDIDATIGASRDKLRALDTQGARELLQAKIDEENAERTRRLVPLLKERAEVERLAFDHAAAQATLGEIVALSPDDFWAWVDLGDSYRLTHSLSDAKRAYAEAEAAARRTGDERNLSVSQNKIGDVLVAEGDREGALAAYRAGLAIGETLARRDPGNTEWQRDLSVSHQRIGDVLVAEGDREGALAAYRAGLAIGETLARRDPGNTLWQRDLSVSHERIGDVLVAEGDREGALAAYRAGLAIGETLARRDPGNTLWQRDLSVSQNKIGDVLVSEGDREGALAAYRAGLAIGETLARRDPGNTLWQRDLSVSQNKIGDVLVAEGDREGALAAYRAGLAIGETLARRDPGNTEWQRDLSVSHERIGDVLVAEGDREGALAAYRAGLAIAETLTRRDPGNTQWQRDLSVSHNKIGDVLVAEGDREGALAAYRAGLAIRETLARRDPGNTQWQRDLSVSHSKIGDVLVAEGDREGALAAYRAGLAIAETLTRRDPGNTQWQRDLSVSHDRIGDVLVAEGDREGALAAYRAGLAIRETLARRDPGNTQWQRDLSVSHNKIGDVLRDEGDRDGALQSYRADLAIAETLARRDPGNTLWQRDLIVSCWRIAEADREAAPALFARALEIAKQLQSSGKLAPIDAWIPDALARRLAED